MRSGKPSGVGAVEFIEAATNRRATTYRDRAAQLAALADAELIGSIRDQLRALAARYQELAASVELAPSSAPDAEIARRNSRDHLR